MSAIILAGKNIGFPSLSSSQVHDGIWWLVSQDDSICLMLSCCTDAPPLWNLWLANLFRICYSGPELNISLIYQCISAFGSFWTHSKCWASKGFDGELKLQPTSPVAKRGDEDEDEDEATYLHAAWSVLVWTCLDGLVFDAVQGASAEDQFCGKFIDESRISRQSRPIILRRFLSLLVS